MDLGAATEIAPAGLAANAFVRIHGTPMASKTVHFQRVLGNDAYSVFPLAGQRTILIVVTHSVELAARLPERRQLVDGRLEAQP